MADQDPRATPAAPNHPASGPVTAGEIAQFLHRLTRRRPPALGGDPAEHAALLACKADLFARIADQHAHTDPAHAGQARQAAQRARAAAARHAENPETQDSTDVNDLTSPSTPRWGISPSNTADFRRASSPGPLFGGFAGTTGRSDFPPPCIPGVPPTAFPGRPIR